MAISKLCGKGQIFHGSARNSTTLGKLWALEMSTELEVAELRACGQGIRLCLPLIHSWFLVQYMFVFLLIDHLVICILYLLCACVIVVGCSLQYFAWSGWWWSSAWPWCTEGCSQCYYQLSLWSNVSGKLCCLLCIIDNFLDISIWVRVTYLSVVWKKLITIHS